MAASSSDGGAAVATGALWDGFAHEVCVAALNETRKMTKENVLVFEKPVDLSAYTDYTTHVARPICFSDIEVRGACARGFESPCTGGGVAWRGHGFWLW